MFIENSAASACSFFLSAHLNALVYLNCNNVFISIKEMSYYGPSSVETILERDPRGHYCRLNTNTKTSRPKGRRDSSFVRLLKPDDADASNELSIQGYSCTLYRDDALASYIDGENHLELWQDIAQRDLWIDRFDARALLGSYEDFSFDYLTHAYNSVDEPYEDVEERLLNEERYGDLVLAIKQSRGAANRGPPSALEDNNKQGQKEVDRIDTLALESSLKPSLSIDNYDDMSNTRDTPHEKEAIDVQQPSERDAGELLSLPSGLSVPEGITVPAHNKAYDVLMFTAMRSRKSGQLEVLLKLRSDQNPIFGFLKPESIFYPFYEYVKRLDEDMFRCFLLREAPSIRPISENMQAGVSFRSDALSMLCAYEDDEVEHIDAVGSDPLGHGFTEERIGGLSKAPEANKDLDDQTFDSAYALIEALLNDPIGQTNLSSENIDESISSKQRDRLEKARMMRDVYSRSLSSTATTAAHPVIDPPVAAAECAASNLDHPCANPDMKHSGEDMKVTGQAMTGTNSESGRAIRIGEQSRSRSRDRGRSRRNDRESEHRRTSWSRKRFRRSRSRTRSNERSPELRSCPPVTCSSHELMGMFTYTYQCTDNMAVKLPFFINGTIIRRKIQDLMTLENYSRL